MTFDLISMGTILGFTSTKLDSVANYTHPYSCNYPRAGECDAVTLMGVEYFGCAVALLDV